MKRMHITGKECRTFIPKGAPLRRVPGFSYQALQKNTLVVPPAKIHIFRKRPVNVTLFKLYFRRGDIPVSRIMAGNGKKGGVKWFCDPKDLDYCYYLPIFVDGLADRDPNIRSIAETGAMDMILKAPNKIIAVLPKLILPLKRAFNTRDKEIVVAALKILQTMVYVGPCVGLALVPYYRQLLSVCNLYKTINVNLGSGIDPNRAVRIGDVIEDTLSLLETCGGPNAFINIKYMIPTYESSVFPICELPKERPVTETNTNPVVVAPSQSQAQDNVKLKKSASSAKQTPPKSESKKQIAGKQAKSGKKKK